MRSVSSNIMAGQIINAGTGLCDILLDVDAIENSTELEDQEFDSAKIIEVKENPLLQTLLEKSNNNNSFVPL